MSKYKSLFPSINIESISLKNRILRALPCQITSCHSAFRIFCFGKK